MSTPTLSDVTAAWHALPAETRDRIGIIAVDMVLQDFVSGEAYFDSFEDLPVLDDQARNAARAASDGRLNEMHKVVERALPSLFGTDTAHPDWSENAGPAPTPAALTYAAQRRAEEARRTKLQRSLRIRLGRRGLRLYFERGGYVVAERGTGTTKAESPSLDGIAAWLAQTGRPCHAAVA